MSASEMAAARCRPRPANRPYLIIRLARTREATAMNGVLRKDVVWMEWRPGVLGRVAEAARV